MTSLETELEYKFDVPFLHGSEEQVIQEALDKLERWIKECGINVVWRKEENRVLRYFDSSDLRNAHQGWTMRHVTGFDPDRGDGKNDHRYDLKVGQINTEDRLEANRWSDNVLSPDEFTVLFDLDSEAAVSQVVCRTVTIHHKFLVYFLGTRIEISLDIICDQGHNNELLLIELEFELQDAISYADTLRDMVEEIRQYFPEDQFPQTTEQKYTRLMASRL